ncbi:queuine tRNA-ribosyltransferase tRNA-guanine transglycosylase [Halomarina oriensis]|uniref:Queuine tRNA-ribosyltransferase tRNA-guanine transglycosylase n=1 Tax=Halomarina oriensis TaxID=671145 RepID=A0A6B0GWJ1_9EURY|nr:queuine tRNA-ribosyltransferase tRNA-guanine transglycosylase [Halomarina oriensis]MWG36108.1 queuine tRNA-ribosyltransferase tRNA-guanine transglycosylase [Halomarina oriensis]
MRFYVPEWDDAVDAGYDFEFDELSELDREERTLDYIWDVFEDPEEQTPIDGVLISREQVEETDRKARRLKEYGVHGNGEPSDSSVDEPALSIPEWMPTISDCGAWGYKSLPFPPYGNQEMLEFYETLGVDIGVTIDHLVLGSGKDKGRLYLDSRAFGDGFSKKDLPEQLTDVVDLMIDEWPSEWPPYVMEYEPTICTESDEAIDLFTAETFAGDVDSVLSRLETDSRAVYRSDDKQFRYDLTLRNAAEMYDLYEEGDYPFRLMVAIQGWTPWSYVEAAEQVLDTGYDYLGIGGVAGSPIHNVRKIVKAVGRTITQFEREHATRVDPHVFGFAKTDAFETIGRSGMASFDSASMLRSAWTGGRNYRLTAEERYDAIRVRYPSSRDDLATAVKKTVRGREALVALRAYAEEESIIDALDEWENEAETVLPATREYLQEHRHASQFDESLLQDVETAFRDGNDADETTVAFEQARALQAYFSGELRNKLVKLLRKDDPESSVPIEEYDELLTVAEEQFESVPRIASMLDEQEDSYDQIWTIISEYARYIGDDDLLEEYQRTLKARPWEQCDCPICDEHGVEVCIFRGNDRNRRRGFHNTHQFYNEFAESLPKILIATQGTDRLDQYETVEEYLRSEHSAFWEQVHDLPVAEVGVLTEEGVHEWWDETPSGNSFDLDSTADGLGRQTTRYQHLFVHTLEANLDDAIVDAVEGSSCTLHTFDDAAKLRVEALSTCGRNYVAGDDFLPHAPELATEDGLNILVIDQCSGSKEIPNDARVFDADETLHQSREHLLGHPYAPEIAAGDLYTGRQQKYVTEAVRRLKNEGHTVDRHFISAGFGLVSSDDRLPPYEVTFSSMNVSEIRFRSEQLNIQSDVEQLLAESDYDVVFFTLGKDYYTSIDIDEMVQQVPADRIGVVFNRELVDGQFENIVSVPARTDDAKEHGTIVVGLKGLYMKNFSRRIGEVDVLTPDLIEELCRRLDEEPTQKRLNGVNNE